MTKSSHESSCMPMVCPACGITMNCHAENEAYDVTIGGFIEEFHTCPAAGIRNPDWKDRADHE